MSAPDPEAAGRAYDVLLVEDDPDTREVTAEALVAAGYVVQAAADGQEALDTMALRGLPRVVLLDLMMPRMNGWQFRAAQRADPRLALVPVLLVSAGPGLEEQARVLEVAGAVRKPVELAVLLEAVGRLVAEPAGRRRPRIG